MRLKELSVELRDRIVSRNRSEEGYQSITAALMVPKNTVVLVREVTKNLMVTLTELQSSSVEMG
jgi:hypothetical protein